MNTSPHKRTQKSTDKHMRFAQKQTAFHGTSLNGFPCLQLWMRPDAGGHVPNGEQRVRGGGRVSVVGTKQTWEENKKGNSLIERVRKVPNILSVPISAQTLSYVFTEKVAKLLRKKKFWAGTSACYIGHRCYNLNPSKIIAWLKK